MRERHPTHGYDHSYGESKNAFKFSVSSEATKSEGKPKGASGGGIKAAGPKGRKSGAASGTGQTGSTPTQAGH